MAFTSFSRLCETNMGLPPPSWTIPQKPSSTIPIAYADSHDIFAGGMRRDLMRDPQAATREGPNTMNRSELEELRQLSAAVGVKLPRSMNNSRTEREFFDKKGSMGVYFGRRCLQCLTALPIRARKDQRFCCNACKCASWRFIGGIGEFEHRYGEGAELRRAQR